MSKRGEGDAPVMISEAAIADAFARGQRAWPGIDLAVADYATYLTAAQFSGPAAALHEDLYLACACVLGITAAHETLERSIMPDVPKAIRRVSPEADFVADVTADLRLMLLTGSEEKSSLLARYQGLGPLRSFVMVLAMRRAADRKRRTKEITTAPEDLVDLATEGIELAHADSVEMKEAFLVALKEQLATLPSRDRNILRLHVIDGVPAEAIGRMYGVHRATATRWITQVKQTVFDETRAVLQRRFNVSPATFESFAREEKLGFDATLTTFLGS